MNSCKLLIYKNILELFLFILSSMPHKVPRKLCRFLFLSLRCKIEKEHLPKDAP